MRKRLFTPTPQGIQSHDAGWLDLDRTASVEVTSEEEDYGIDSALVSGETQGWRAASPGTQTIRLIFDEPQRLTRISRLRGNRDRAYPRVRLAMVWGWRALISKDCAPAVEFQPTQHDT
jgi:hypothetical protein